MLSLHYKSKVYNVTITKNTSPVEIDRFKFLLDGATFI